MKTNSSYIYILFVLISAVASGQSNLDIEITGQWLADNGGDLDKYNGRFCKTPEYPEGTYIKSGTNQAISKVEIYNGLGETVYSAAISTSEVNFSLDAKAGLYYVKCTNGTTGTFSITKLLIDPK